MAEDGDQGFFDRLRSLPAPRLALPAGRVLGDITVVAWGAIVTAAMGLLVGFELHGTLVEGLLALGDPNLAGLGHTTTYWVVLSMVWSGGILAVFAPLALALYRRSA